MCVVCPYVNSSFILPQVHPAAALLHNSLGQRGLKRTEQYLLITMPVWKAMSQYSSRVGHTFTCVERGLQRLHALCASAVAVAVCVQCVFQEECVWFTVCVCARACVCLEEFSFNRFSCFVFVFRGQSPRPTPPHSGHSEHNVKAATMQVLCICTDKEKKTHPAH